MKMIWLFKLCGFNCRIEILLLSQGLLKNHSFNNELRKFEKKGRKCMFLRGVLFFLVHFSFLYVIWS